MGTYTTLEGDVIDLAQLNAEEVSHFQRCAEAYRAQMQWRDFHALARGTSNAHIRKAGGVITRMTWNHPLFRVTQDMEDRLAITQGGVRASEGDRVDSDPFADEWIPVSEAAAQKGVTSPGIHQAIRRGTVIARQASDGKDRLEVSINSLRRWTPNATRQAARKSG